MVKTTFSHISAYTTEERLILSVVMIYRIRADPSAIPVFYAAVDPASIVVGIRRANFKRMIPISTIAI